MKIYFFNTAAIIFASLLIMTSCGSDDENSNNTVGDKASNLITDCPTFYTDQVAQGVFLEESFISSGGIYRDQSFGGETEYFCKIYIKSPLDMEDCGSPKFEGNRDTMLFSINSLKPQTFKVFDEFISDNGELNKTLIFNRVTEIDAVTISELSCGVVTITKYDDVTGEIHGNVVAKGVNGSSVDGSFVLDFCDKNIF